MPSCAILFSVKLMEVLLEFGSGLEVVNMALVFAVLCSASLKFLLDPKTSKGFAIEAFVSIENSVEQGG